MWEQDKNKVCEEVFRDLNTRVNDTKYKVITLRCCSGHSAIHQAKLRSTGGCMRRAESAHQAKQTGEHWDITSSISNMSEVKKSRVTWLSV